MIKIYFKLEAIVKEINVNIYSEVGSELCVDAEDGEKVFEKLKKILEAGNKVKLSFKNVDLITTAFLNTAIGQLYGEFNEKQIQGSMSVEDMQDEDKFLLKRVTTAAKEFYKDPSKIKEAEDIILEEG